MQYIVTNFAYGYGPFLRTTELALAVNAERTARGLETFGIIVPWVYGERQRRIMLEEFKDDASCIYLDEALGAILRRVFYADSSYEAALAAWTEQFEQASSDARRHLAGVFPVVSLSGESLMVDGSHIAFAIARAPRVSFAPLPSYSATFGHISEILEHTLKEPAGAIAADRALVERALPIAKRLEDEQSLIGLATPGTFTYRESRTPLANEEAIPPTIRESRIDDREMAPGIYVTITGIPGLEHLYEQARALGLTIYTNDPGRLPGSVQASPDVIGNDAIKLAFARAGWGSIWGAQLLNKAIVVPPFDPHDDPEIYFNNLCIEALGLGIVFNGQDFGGIMRQATTIEATIAQTNAALMAQFGTLNGSQYIARRIIALL